jgi:ubiquinone/menaquinone biosynthesis C-methylase UbiE
MNTELKRWVERDGVTFLSEIGLGNGQILLDFGCGEGHYTLPASAVVGDRGKVYAIDKGEDVLKKLGKTLKSYGVENVELIHTETSIPLRDGSIDVALCYDVIHYMDERRRAAIYRDLYRVLKRDALLSVYPKHHRRDTPLMELANTELKSVRTEIEAQDFLLIRQLSTTLLHDENYNEGEIMNFRRRS